MHRDAAHSLGGTLLYAHRVRPLIKHPIRRHPSCHRSPVGTTRPRAGPPVFRVLACGTRLSAPSNRMLSYPCELTLPLCSTSRVSSLARRRSSLLLAGPAAGGSTGWLQQQQRQQEEEVVGRPMRQLLPSQRRWLQSSSLRSMPCRWWPLAHCISSSPPRRCR